MALILVFHNDSTGADKAANYNVDVMVNTRIIARGRVEGHPRNEGWKALVQKFLNVASTEHP